MDLRWSIFFSFFVFFSGRTSFPPGSILELFRVVLFLSSSLDRRDVSASGCSLLFPVWCPIQKTWRMMPLAEGSLLEKQLEEDRVRAATRWSSARSRRILRCNGHKINRVSLWQLGNRPTPPPKCDRAMIAESGAVHRKQHVLVSISKDLRVRVVDLLPSFLVARGTPFVFLICLLDFWRWAREQRYEGFFLFKIQRDGWGPLYPLVCLVHVVVRPKPHSPLL